MKKTYKIEVDCANCANKMEEATKKTAGVKDATVNFMTLKMIVEFEENADIIDTTLGALEQVIDHNAHILDVNKYSKEHLVATIGDWRNKQRNGYFHKQNLHDIKKVDDIREKALQLYFLILGSCTIKDEQFSDLGIDTSETMF